MKQMVKKVHYKISQDLFIRDKKHHESGVFYFPKILLKNKCSLFCVKLKSELYLKKCKKITR